MSDYTRIGIIDIGSNSIRLVIYEKKATGAHRVVSEYKDSARLSERIGPDGILHKEDILSIVPILSHFNELCKVNDVHTIRIAATAAIRNAANSNEIIQLLEHHTGMKIEVLSGDQEALYGFLGVINSIDIRDGFIVDIGGGSTEVTLFQDRKLKHSISFPFGSVNTTQQFAKGGVLTELILLEIRQMVEEAMNAAPWIQSVQGLPLVGLGGTARTLGKMSQKHLKYSLPLTHNYVLMQGELDHFLNLLSSIPLEKRKKIEGLSKERADIMIPGLTILQTIFDACQASSIVISGSGLRDGLLWETIQPHQPKLENVLETSIQNLLSLHPNAAEKHVQHVNQLALQLFDQLMPSHALSDRHRTYLHAAALLYRIGVSVHYYQFNKHTQYMIAHSRIDGFSHREIMLCSLVASFKAKNRTHQLVLLHKDILAESDERMIHQLGTLLQLAIALDRSETQKVTAVNISIHGTELRLQLHAISTPHAELKELEAVRKDFEKVFGLKLKVATEASSMK
ncbi:Exopolyphosphatase [compost metagenome]